MRLGKNTLFPVLFSIGCLFFIVVTVSGIPVDITTTGALSVVSDPPGSGVFLDGFSKGFTPITINYLAPGQHDLELSHPGYSGWRTTVTVAAGETTPVSGTLTLLPTKSRGWIYIYSTPGGASVTIDGYPAGKTVTGSPLKLGDIPTGEHEITLVLDGYQSETLRPVVKADTISEESVHLKPVAPAPGYGILVVSSTPAGAGVFVDNTYIGVTPLSGVMVPEGSHLVSVRDRGYQEYLVPVLMTTGLTTTVEAALSPEVPVPTKSPLTAVTAIGAVIAFCILVAREMKK